MLLAQLCFIDNFIQDHFDIFTYYIHLPRKTLLCTTDITLMLEMATPAV